MLVHQIKDGQVRDGGTFPTVAGLDFTIHDMPRFARLLQDLFGQFARAWVGNRIIDYLALHPALFDVQVKFADAQYGYALVEHFHAVENLLVRPAHIRRPAPQVGNQFPFATAVFHRAVNQVVDRRRRAFGGKIFTGRTFRARHVVAMRGVFTHRNGEDTTQIGRVFTQIIGSFIEILLHFGLFHTQGTARLPAEQFFVLFIHLFGQGTGLVEIQIHPYPVLFTTGDELVEIFPSLFVPLRKRRRKRIVGQLRQ